MKPFFNSMKTTIMFIFIIIFIGMVILFAYNFLANADNKLYGDDNKFNEDGSTKGSYDLESKNTSFILKALDVLGKFKKIVVLIFIGVLLVVFFVTKQGILYWIAEKLGWK